MQSRRAGNARDDIPRGDRECRHAVLEDRGDVVRSAHGTRRARPVRTGSATGGRAPDRTRGARPQGGLAGRNRRARQPRGSAALRRTPRAQLIERSLLGTAGWAGGDVPRQRRRIGEPPIPRIPRNGFIAVIIILSAPFHRRSAGGAREHYPSRECERNPFLEEIRKKFQIAFRTRRRPGTEAVPGRRVARVRPGRCPRHRPRARRRPRPRGRCRPRARTRPRPGSRCGRPPRAG